MKNVAAQVALQTVWKDKRGQSGRGWGGGSRCPETIKQVTKPGTSRVSEDFATQ